MSETDKIFRDQNNARRRAHAREERGYTWRCKCASLFTRYDGGPKICPDCRARRPADEREVKDGE